MIDPVAAREVFEANKKIILSAPCIRISVWNDIQRYERGLQIMERDLREKEALAKLKKEQENEDRLYADSVASRRATGQIIQFTPRVSRPQTPDGVY